MVVATVRCDNPFQICSNGDCVFPNKECVSNCSGHGVCRFQNADTGASVMRCLVGDINCVAVCDCVEEYAGTASCYLSKQQLLIKQNVRSQVIDSLNSIVLSGTTTVTSSSVVGWIGSITDATQVSEELTISSALVVLNTSSSIISHATNVSLSSKHSIKLLNTLDAVAGIISSKGSLKENSEISANDKEKNIAQLDFVINELSKLVLADMVIGQTPIQSTTNQIRFIVQKLFPNSINNKKVNNYTISTPLTLLEKASKVQSASIVLPVQTSSELSIKMYTLRSQMFGNSKFNSNPLSITLSSPPCEKSNCSQSRIEILLPNIEKVTSKKQVYTETANISCSTGRFIVTSYKCRNGFVFNMTCNGLKSEIKNYICPNVTAGTSCKHISSGGQVLDSCYVLEYSDSFVKCSCPIANNRRLLSQNISDSFTTEYSVNYVSLLESTYSSFIQTTSSITNIESNVGKSWKVLIVIGSFLVVVLILISFSQSMDMRDAKNKLAILDSSNLKSVLVKSKRMTPVKEIGSVNSQFPNWIENSFAGIWKERKLSDKIVDEVKHHHRWFAVFYTYNEHFPRAFRIMSLTFNVLLLLFVQSLTYALENPDNGLCETFTTRVTCLEPRSPYATGEPNCNWSIAVDGKGSCTFIPVDDRWKIILFVALFSAIVSAPIAISITWCTENIICARIDEENKKSEVVSKVKEKDDLMSKQSRAFGKVVHDESMNIIKVMSEMTSLANDIRSYRDTLSNSERKEFDGKNSSINIYIFIYKGFGDWMKMVLSLLVIMLWTEQLLSVVFQQRKGSMFTKQF